ncbi:hypothetical protein N7499_000872 [Penicillium canescens]|uniref:NmrA-like domain-containing protein n=1 Tax=Penicillium canescens TaxID=5083 RepID=A0AAD6I1X2_PENCN|nr:uncharacterized protein N7446_004085 [Penicillium canescens]KAJ6027317.1 hypothetical protein N7460_012134 [Penicillium canescens]KAJ6040600.1 hypothetical protein N7444_009505 [Penicillium canescens]KAJ6067048.1 hypothetical protein N7446_004085 [Penicillium canescens]KAJ6101242.1 hypothetical protein N7499_000872 [Penicillium canescens]KAJ6173700.1 hypothetical protein N7485_006512 [Penicillium canescens]
MSKLVVVIGATGSQGGAVVSALLQDPIFKIRGLTRNTNSKGAQALAAQGVEVVAADLNDEKSLIEAFRGAHAIYAITDFFEPFVKEGPEKAIEIEYQQGLNLARAASKTSTLEHYIWSTLPDAMALSKGQVAVPHFAAKARVDAFIKADKSLLSKTVFLWITFYASNLFYPMFTPIDAKPAGRYIIMLPVAPTTQVASLGPLSNVGLAVRTVLTNPFAIHNADPLSSTPARYLLLTTGFYDFRDYYNVWAKAANGKTASGTTNLDVEVLEISMDAYDTLWPLWGKEMGLMLKFWELVGPEKSWSTVHGDDVMVRLQDLLKETGPAMVGTEEAFGELDWSSV